MTTTRAHSTITIRLHRDDSLIRLPASMAGNPRWQMSFARGGTYRTATNSMCAYGVENFWGSRRPDAVTLTLDNRGLVIGIDPA